MNTPQPAISTVGQELDWAEREHLFQAAIYQEE